MQRYEHGGDIYTNANTQLDFSVNTNPLGMPGEIRRALVSRADEFERYPDPKCRELCTAISKYEKVPENWILCGNGAADLIYRLCYALKPRKALVCAPTFSEYERALEQVNCQIVHYGLSAENKFMLTNSILEWITPEIDILFICNPNNPTGRLIPKELMLCILNKAGENDITVAVDECFLDFTNGVSAKAYLRDMPKLVILKAFTKMYAMPGLRLGYMLTASESILGKAEYASQCWGVSVPAQIAGTTALSLTGWREKTLRIIEKERSFLSDKLLKLGITVFPSDVNFILINSEKALYEPLLQKGILIRSCANFIGLGKSYYRISVKTRAGNARLIQAVKETLNG